jgi:hypothetical protein
MCTRIWRTLLVISVSILPLNGQNNAAFGAGTNSDSLAKLPPDKVPAGVILVKGAWSSASDSTTPLPETSSVAGNTFHNSYFGINYALPQGWIELFHGPPPSDTGLYVLAQLAPSENSNTSARGSILITAEDMFFTPFPASNALELVKDSTDHLQADHRLEQPPTQITINGIPFVLYKYGSPSAGLHWYVLATDIRCHTVEFILSSQDTHLLDALMQGMNHIQLSLSTAPATEGAVNSVPVCIKDYATDANLLSRVEPSPSEHRFNAVPVRIIIDKDGAIRHIHFLSAFPDQEKSITAALKQWKFRPYVRNGKHVEVETGIMFGHPLNRPPASVAKATE